MSKQQRASGRHRASSSAAGRAGTGSRTVRKPRIAKPQPRINTAEIQGLFSPYEQDGQTTALGRGVLGTERESLAAGAGVGAGVGASGGGDFMTLFNRMGGLDGILSTMGKVQKMVTIFRQFGPIFKLFGGGFGLGGLAKTASLKRHSTHKGTRRSVHPERSGRLGGRVLSSSRHDRDGYKPKGRH
ncbi:hypothetical protein [Paenibacillus puerhi]|uniref:hypothetical protein n=1 Tax=Paenibacillus puerhi TaxID=2692622 RepID=UPI001F302B67|nr:hypothetical protein [Paenibacillus puerhi]